MVRFGYTIAYVDDVDRELTFFENAFGLERRFLDPSGDYGELDTGNTVLAFASHELGRANFPGGYLRANSDKPLGMEVAMVTDDVNATHKAAVEYGAKEIREPEKKPWGQDVSYVVSPSGILLICSPLAG